MFVFMYVYPPGSCNHSTRKAEAGGSFNASLVFNEEKIIKLAFTFLHCLSSRSLHFV